MDRLSSTLRLNLILLASFLFLVVQLQGCATVTRGTEEALVVESKPSGAKVTVVKMTKHVHSDPARDQQVNFRGGYDVNKQKPGQGTTGKPAVYVRDPKFEEMSGTTPTSFKLTRTGQYILTFEKEGCETHKATVNCQVSKEGGAAMAGNICLGGCIGAGVDSSSGGMNELVPNPLEVELVALGQKEAIDEKTGQTIEKRLRQLKLLRDGGYITEEEYENKRKELIDQL